MKEWTGGGRRDEICDHCLLVQKLEIKSDNQSYGGGGGGGGSLFFRGVAVARGHSRGCKVPSSFFSCWFCYMKSADEYLATLHQVRSLEVFLSARNRVTRVIG